MSGSRTPVELIVGRAERRSPQPTRLPLAEILRSVGEREAGRRAGRGHDRRRGPGRPGAADLARGAGAAVRRRDPVRRPGGAGDSRLRAAGGTTDAGRQDRLRALVQAGRHQPVDDRARQARPPRGAPQGRRSAGLRPRRRGDCRLPGCEHTGRGGAGHHSRARRREPACGLAHASGCAHSACNMSPATPKAATCPRRSIGEASPTRTSRPRSTCRRRRSAHSPPRRLSQGSIQTFPPSRSRARHDRMRLLSPARSPPSPNASRPPLQAARCWFWSDAF